MAKLVEITGKALSGEWGIDDEIGNGIPVLRTTNFTNEGVVNYNAEPFKLWLAQVGRERIEEIIDPELTIDRALETYSKKGYPADWINQRLQTIRARKELTDEWQTLSG